MTTTAGAPCSAAPRRPDRRRRVGHLVARGHVDAGERRAGPRGIGAPAGRRRRRGAARGRRRRSRRRSPRPRPPRSKSMNGATGSGFENAHTPPIRTTGSSGGGRARRSGMPAIRRRRSGVDVVALVGHREADEVEVGQRALGLEREGRGAGPPRTRRYPPGSGRNTRSHTTSGQRVQMRVDGLKAEVRHADGVGIGIDEGDRDASAPVLADDALFARDEGLAFFFSRQDIRSVYHAAEGRTGRETPSETTRTETRPPPRVVSQRRRRRTL